MHDGCSVTAREIEDTMNMLVSLYWKDPTTTGHFLKGALCALDKITDYKKKEALQRDFFKDELSTAVVDDVSEMVKRDIEKGIQTSFLS